MSTLLVVTPLAAHRDDSSRVFEVALVKRTAFSLESQRDAVDTIVVDRAEWPSPN